eukprot:8602902-Karenia_brevis.AAC.1
MTVGVDGVRALNSSLIGQLLPPPAGGPLAVKQSVPVSSHVGQSGYAKINQKLDGCEFYDAESGSGLRQLTNQDRARFGDGRGGDRQVGEGDRQEWRECSEHH